MIRIASIVLLLAVSPMASFAASINEELALKFLIAHKDPEGYDACARILAEKYIKNMGEPKNMTPEQEKLYPIIVSKVKKVFLQRVGWDAHKEELVKVYASTYSVSELNALVSFYESDAGKSIALKTTSISVKCMEVSSQKFIGITAAIEAELARPEVR